MSANELALTQPAGLPSWSFTPTAEQIELIKGQICPDLSNGELSLFLEVCKTRGLNPITKQIYAIKRQGKMTIQTSIDGYLLIAERTGKYEGCKTWTTGEGSSLKGHAAVYRKGSSLPIEVEVDFEEFTQKQNLWLSKPKWMIQKVALARALARAFPEDLGGLYTDDEMPPIDVTPAKVARSTSIDALEAKLASQVAQKIEFIAPKSVQKEHDRVEERVIPKSRFDRAPEAIAVLKEAFPDAAKADWKPDAKMPDLYAEASKMVTVIDPDQRPMCMFELTFGKHKGKALAEVPDDYLQWMLSTDGQTNPKTGKKNELDKKTKAAIMAFLGIEDETVPYDANDVPF